jgi:hypothetical protein
MKNAGGLAGMLSALALGLVVSGGVTAQDLERNQVIKPIKRAWRDHMKCFPESYCMSYFESFGVALVFADGSAQPFEHVRRMTASAHDCIQRAKDYLAQGDRVRAVEWAMASQTSMSVRDWMRDHPDEVLEILRDCCS